MNQLLIMKKKNSEGGLVYSTGNLSFNEDEIPHFKEPGEQHLKVWLDKKQRAGKIATLITGFEGDESGLIELCKMLKNKCGVGGSAKDGEMIIQGDHRDKVIALLTGAGYNAKKAGG